MYDDIGIAQIIGIIIFALIFLYSIFLFLYLLIRNRRHKDRSVYWGYPTQAYFETKQGRYLGAILAFLIGIGLINYIFFDWENMQHNTAAIIGLIICSVFCLAFGIRNIVKNTKAK